MLDNKIHYDPSLTGKGKTYGLLKSLCESDGKIIIAVPSIKLANEYKKNCTGKIRCQVINSEEKGIYAQLDTCGVLENYIKKINLGNIEENVLIITHETLKRSFITGINGLEGWSLYIDENIDLYFNHSFELSRLSAEMLLNNFDFKKHGDGKTYSVEPKKYCEHLINDIGNGNIIDTFWEKEEAKNFLSCLSSSAFFNLVFKDDHEKIKKVADGSHSYPTAYMSILSTIEPIALDKFESVTILSALFQKTIMANIFEIIGFDIVEKRYATSHVNIHENGSRLKIYYVKNGYNSICYKQTCPDKNSNKDYEDYIVEEYIDMIGGEKFIFNANVDSRCKKVYTHHQSDHPLEQIRLGRGELLSEVAGINNYDDFHHALYTTARNPTQSEASVLSAFGVDKQRVNDDRNFLSAYQFVSRTSIRDKFSSEIVHCYVIDKETAIFLKSLWPDATIEQVEVPKVNVGKTPKKKLIPNKNDEKCFDRVMAKYHKKGERKFSKNVRERFIKLCEGSELIETKKILEVFDYMRAYPL